MTRAPGIQPLNRIKKVNMILASEDNWSPHHETDDKYKHRVGTICEAIMATFKGTHILRNTFHLQFGAFNPGMIEVMYHFLFTLRAFNGFRKILVEMDLEAGSKEWGQGPEPKKEGSDGEALARVEEIKQMIKNALEPGLGPAVTSNGTNATFRICLKFKPREHVPAFSRPQAQDLLLELSERLRI